MNQEGINNYLFIFFKNFKSGTFAIVKLGINKLTGEKVAIKIIDKTKMTTSGLRHYKKK